MGGWESKEPIVEKVVSHGEAYNLKFGVFERQGWRAKMVKSP